MKKSIVFFLVLSLSGFASAKAQLFDTLFVAFWNVENLFDTVDDPQKNDEDFLPEGKLKWTKERFDEKCLNLAKAIRAMNDGRGPDIIGLAEVENKFVLETLTSKYLLDLNYKIAHLESPDERGIDVALLFRGRCAKSITITGHTVRLPDNNPTRLILQVDLLCKKKETATFFINHWPSRRGGEEKSEINRVTAASVLKAQTQKLLKSQKNAHIIIMGDFNDEPANISIRDTLGAAPFACSAENSPSELYNLAWEKKQAGEGTLKYRDNWNMLDQIIVSKSLLSGKFKYICNSFAIFKPFFLVTQTGKYKDSPAPFYGGERYLGGYSDHFPVTAKFLIALK